MADPGFPRRRGRQLPRGAPTYDLPKFPQNCMKLKEFGPPGGMRPLVPPLDLPLIYIQESRGSLWGAHFSKNLISLE